MQDYALTGSVPFIWHLGELGYTHKIHGVNQIDDILTEFEHEELIGERLSRYQAPHEEMVSIMFELGKRVAMMSNLYLIHHDLIPENILVQDSLPYITDWNMAVLRDRSCYDPNLNREVFIVAIRNSDSSYIDAFSRGYNSNLSLLPDDGIAVILNNFRQFVEKVEANGR